MGVQTNVGTKNLTIVRGMVRAASSSADKFIIVENEIGMDTIYTLISLGYYEKNIAESLGMTRKEFEFMVKQTPTHREKYLSAKLYPAGEDAVDQLANYAQNSTMEVEEKMAADVHHKTLAAVFKTSEDKSLAATGAVINNIVYVRNENDIPEMPEDLKEIIHVNPDN